MNQSLFSSLEQVLVAGESLRFTVQKRTDSLILLLQPIVAKANDVPKDAEHIRAALSLPLRLAGTASELDAVFGERLRGYANARQEAHGSYSALIGALNEASKEAKSKTSTSKGGASVPKPAGSANNTTAAARTESAPVSHAETKDEIGQPMSLL